MEFDKLSHRVIGCAIEVHRELGPGLLESAYEQCLAHELRKNSILFQLQQPQPVRYKDVALDCGYRIDLLVEGSIILELKSVEKLKVHLGLVWVEIESTAVEIDGGLEVLSVSVAADATFDRHDLAVHALGHRVCDSVGTVADDIG